MGSNQSSLNDRRHSLRWPRKSSSHHHGQLEQKLRKSSVLTLNSGRHYEHLSPANDNSARSSPSEEPSSSPGSKGRRVSSNADSTLTFCPCFHGDHQSKQTKRCEDVVPGQRSDSVSLLRVSRRSDRKLRGAAEPEYESSLLQEKLDRQSDEVSSQEKLSPTDDADGISDGFRDVAGCVGSVSFCDDVVDIRPTTDLSDGWTSRNRSAELLQELERDVCSRNEKWLTKKCRSFLGNLSRRSKSKFVSEQFSRRDLVTELRDGVAVKNNPGTNEGDYTSNATSCEDSGKASEMDACLRLWDRSDYTKAPIAKIDSLETTSIDSLDSDHPMLDSICYSCRASAENVGVRKLSQSPRRSIPPSNVGETGILNPTLASDNTFKDLHQDLCTGVELIRSFNPSPILIENSNEQRIIKRNLTEEKEKRHLSCPFPETSRTPLHEVDLSSVTFDIASAASDDLLSSRVSLESSNRHAASTGECIILNRRTYLDLVGEVETFRTMLVHLGTVLIRQDQHREDDSKNNNIVDPLAFADCEGNWFLRSGEIPDNPCLKQKLTLENQNLRRQILLLQAIASEQQESISTLRQKLDKLQNSMQQTSGIETSADVHSAPNFTASELRLVMTV